LLNACYAGATRAPQTMPRPARKMQGMETQQHPPEEINEMTQNHVDQFIAAARQYLFGLNPAEPALATIPAVTRPVR
jgi:hypothetical protein